MKTTTFLSAVTFCFMALIATASAEEYTIFIYETDAELELRSVESEASPQGYWGAYGGYAMELAQAGVLRGGTALHTTSPVSFTEEGRADESLIGADLALSGYFIIDVETAAEAEEFAAKAPSLSRGGHAEVRQAYINPLMAAQ